MRVYTGLIVTKNVAYTTILAESIEEAQKIIDSIYDSHELDFLDFEEDSASTKVIPSWDLSDDRQKFYAEKEIEEAKKEAKFFDKSILNQPLKKD